MPQWSPVLSTGITPAPSYYSTTAAPTPTTPGTYYEPPIIEPVTKSGLGSSYTATTRQPKPNRAGTYYAPPIV